MDNGKYIS